jgi:acetyl-CoA synthetase
VRGGKHVPLKDYTDTAISEYPCVEKVIVVRRTGKEVSMTEGRDTWWHEEVSAPEIKDWSDPVEMILRPYL